MKQYFGIVIEQSLADRSWLDGVRIEARRRPISWDFLLVSVDEDDLTEHLSSLQRAMRDDQPWYAHYFCDDELIVVFKHTALPITCDAETWAPAMDYGLSVGVPREQLDFKPRTTEDARAFFGLT